MEEERVFVFPKSNAWDVSALLSMDIRTDVQPGGETWDDFLNSLHHLVVSVMREARRMAGVVPYRTIPHPSPTDLMTYVIAMKTQYTIEGRVCRVRIGPSSQGLGVFATERIQAGGIVSTIPVDGVYITHHGGVMLTSNNKDLDPNSFMIRNTRYHDIFIASSLLYFCPERCGHMIRFNEDFNATVQELFGGVLFVVTTTKVVEAGEEILLSSHDDSGNTESE